MARRNSSLTFALCASMTVHAMLLYALIWQYVTHPPSLKFEALSKPQTFAPIIIDSAPKPPPPPPPKDDFSDATQTPLKDDSGEATGKGTANRSTSGDQPMEARQGLQQANLNRSPARQNETDSKLDDAVLPAQTGAPLANDASPQTPAFGVDQSKAAAPSNQAGRQPMIAIVDPDHGAVQQPVGDSQQPPGTNSTPTPPSPPVVTQQMNGHDSRVSDTDSFALVAESNHVRFRDGKMEARQGRKVKTPWHEYGLSAKIDAQTILDPRVILGVRVDASGNVYDVAILHSSGSDSIDLDSKSAVYNWWFEPLKDKAGQPLPDRWIVTIE